ncbi:hypothetical protein FGO68_gene3711 [Halteria grandinella]|uniref:SGNH hydrolase-type esterase domain-containing protein n=1 Tax=Halteria grandinella TaxID=5974 RepID=A0A8J8NA78_HALGN|nr:hypothetical protein FGO68_gene3711 [Halteria grandinella]
MRWLLNIKSFVRFTVLVSALAAGGAESSEKCAMAEMITSAPTIPQGYNRLYTFLEQEKTIRSGNVDVLILGDSLLYALKNMESSEYFKNRSVLNFAGPGDRIQNLLWRLEDKKIRNTVPSSIILLIGTNNLADGDPACAIVASLRKAVETIFDIWPRARLVLLTIPYRGPYLMDKRDSVDEVDAEMLEQRFSKERVTVLDTRTLISCNPDPTGAESNKNLAVCDDPAKHTSTCYAYQSDMLHFSSDFTTKLTGELASALRQRGARW